MNRSVLFAAALLLALAAPSAADGPKPRIAVLPFTGTRLDEDSLGVLADQVRSVAPELARSRGYIVMTQESMAVLMKEMGTVCTGQEECEVERARSIGAALVVSGDVRLFGKTLVLGMRMHDTKTGELLAARDVRGGNSQALLKGIDGAARQLLEVGLAREGPNPGEAADAMAAKGEREAGEAPVEFAVAFESQPVGALVEVDGATLCQATPCSRRVAAGVHGVAMKLDRYRTGTAQVKVKRGARVALTLQPIFGWIAMQTEPSGLAITLDGKPAGTSPVEGVEIDPGDHEVAIGDGCWRQAAQRVQVKSGEKLAVKLAGAPRLSRIRVNAEDARGDAVDGTVFVDGRRAGETGETLKVRLCAKEVVVRVADGRSWSGAPHLDEQAVAVIQAAVTTDGKSEKPSPTSAHPAQPAPVRPAQSEQRVPARPAQPEPPPCSLPTACTSLGLDRHYGRKGQTAKPELAAPYYLKACQLGDGAGCTNLGFLYENGTGVEKDLARAAALYKRGCDARNSLGCNNLGVLHDAGRGVAKDEALAAQLFKNGCDLGYHRACNNLALDYEFGTGVSKDRQTAAGFYRRACDGGYAKGCESLKRIDSPSAARSGANPLLGNY